jgi:hypothetical protein
VRGQLAGHADHAHRVGPVGGDREVEDDVVESEDATHVGPELDALVEAEDAAVVVTEAELLGGAEHAVGHDAADLAPLQHEAPRQRGARTGIGHDHARHHVGGTAHDAGLTAAGVDVDELELVGVGVLLDPEHPRDPHTGDLGARLFHALHLEAELVERGHEVGHGRVDRQRGEVADPGEGHQHVHTPSMVDCVAQSRSSEQCSTSSPQYCARKRVSPSKKVLISSMSYRTIAMRSRPKPNAKPV